MDNVISLIISLISGAVGGNVGGAAVSEKKNLGTIANTILGLFGGGLGDFILKALGVLATTTAASAAGAAPTGHELDLSSILATIGVSGVSGGVLSSVAALLKDALQKK